jgi:hypothetical protein
MLIADGAGMGRAGGAASTPEFNDGTRTPPAALLAPRFDSGLR